MSHITKVCLFQFTFLRANAREVEIEFLSLILIIWWLAAKNCLYLLNWDLFSGLESGWQHRRTDLATISWDSPSQQDCHLLRLEATTSGTQRNLPSGTICTSCCSLMTSNHPRASWPLVNLASLIISAPFPFVSNLTFHVLARPAVYYPWTLNSRNYPRRLHAMFRQKTQMYKFTVKFLISNWRKHPYLWKSN